MASSSDEVREALAAYAHEVWSVWMAYLFSKCDDVEGGYLIPPWASARWQRQMRTPYADLPESEKASDRKEADQMMAIVDPRSVISGLQEKAIAVNAHAARMEKMITFIFGRIEDNAKAFEQDRTERGWRATFTYEEAEEIAALAKEIRP